MAEEEEGGVAEEGEGAEEAGDQQLRGTAEGFLFEDEGGEGGEAGEGGYDYESGEFEELMSELSESSGGLTKEYEELIFEILRQNQVVNEFKDKIYEKCQRGIRTKCEERELKNLRCCLEKENLKLQCLIKRAMTLQAEDPDRDWEPIPIATTFEEDSMPLGYSKMVESVCKKTFSDDDDSCRDDGDICPKQDVCQRSDKEVSKSELERFLCCLLQKVKKGDSTSRKKSLVCDSDDESSEINIDPETLQKLICILQGGIDSRMKKNKKKKSDYKNICKELARSYNMQDKLVQDNASLEGDRFKLQEEILNRDRMIDCLQKKLQLMQCELQKLVREKNKFIKQQCEKEGGRLSPKTQKRLKKFKDCAKSLQKNIGSLQCSVEKMKLELCSLKKERDELESQVIKSADICADEDNTNDICGNRKSKADEIEELKKNYTNLLADYCKKTNELKEFQKRVKGFKDPCDKEDSDNIDNEEIRRLQEKVKDLQDEQEEFKCLLKEQREQMDDYRKKYMIAQQKVEEQKCIIEKLEMNNKRIEDQINMEIQRIKTKFQEKLKELAQLPKLLENEQLKLAVACKEKEDLEQKLRLVCKELKACKAQFGGGGDNSKYEQLAAKLMQTEAELAQLQKKYEDLKADKELICEKLQKTQEDLDCLRTESARIIARTKERAESQREILQSRIDKLEKELAQCRATACLSISDREEVIKEMKGQLCTLSYSFDAAQKQIKTLKNHISYLSNENAYPVKC